MQSKKQQFDVKKENVRRKFPDVKSEGPMRKPRGFYARMMDSELVEYARSFCKKHKITMRKELFIEDAGLYQTLNMRRLLPQVIPNSRTKSVPVRWPTDDNDMLVLGVEYCRKNGITSRGELYKLNPKLYHALRYRNMLDTVGLSAKQIEYLSSKSDDELVGIALGICLNENITKRSHLHIRSPTLYTHLLKRKLLGKVIPESFHKRPKRNWNLLTDGELVEMGRDYCLVNWVKSRTELLKSYFSLYNELRKRKRLDEIMPKGRTGPKRSIQ
ncbi:MAG: hypothetical protein QXU54_02615 [Candidatus Micrarchaeia archaeon]